MTAQKNVNIDFNFDEFYEKEMCPACKAKYEAAIGRLVLKQKSNAKR